MATGKLAEVEADAMRIQAKRFRDQEEDLQYQALKAQPLEVKTPEEVLQDVQSQKNTVPVQNEVELVSDENVERAKESADEAKPLSEVSDPSSSDKVEINTNPDQDTKSTASSEESSETSTEESLDSKTKAELVEIADSEGVDSQGLTKAELVKAIEAKQEEGK